MTTISEIRLRLNPWLANAVDYLSQRTEMDYTTITKLALMEYIQRRFTKFDFETIQDVMEGAYQDALDEWVHWNLFLKEIPKDQAMLWKKLAIKSLEFMQDKSHMPLYKEFFKLGDWMKLKKDYESWLVDFLFYQFKIKEYHGELPISKEDKHKALLDQGKEDDYYNLKWNEYAENIISHMKDMTNPLFNILYQIKKDNLLITDRETALFLLQHIIEKKAIQRSEHRFRGPYGPISDHLDAGEVAKALTERKIKDNESIDDFLDRKAWDETEKEIREVKDSIAKAEAVMKHIDPESYALSKRRAKEFADKQAGRDPYAKEKALAKEFVKDEKKGVDIDPSEIDEDVFMEEVEKLQNEKEKRSHRLKNVKKK